LIFKEQTVCHLQSVPVRVRTHCHCVTVHVHTSTKAELFPFIYPLLDIKEDPLIVSI